MAETELHASLAKLIYEGRVMRNLAPMSGNFYELHDWAQAGYEAVANDVMIEVGLIE